MLKRCAADWVSGGQFRAPPKIRQTSSINAMAASLTMPYATIHRYVAALIRLGLVVKAGDGVAVSNDPVTAARIVALLRLAHDTLVRLAEDLAPHMDFPKARRKPSRDLPARIALAALDIWLVPFEYAREPVIDWTSKLVWIFIVVANVRHITVDPVL
ncbi:MAG: hypothetical protein EOO77_37645, partial [Oxalobacteraceae bacterium]